MRTLLIAAMLLTACAGRESSAPDAGESIGQMPAIGVPLTMEVEALDAAVPGVPAQLYDTCALRCERDLSCDVFEPEAYADCHESCLIKWRDCTVLVKFADCVEAAPDVCTAPCDSVCD